MELSFEACGIPLTATAQLRCGEVVITQLRLYGSDVTVLLETLWEEAINDAAQAAYAEWELSANEERRFFKQEERMCTSF